LGGVGVGAIEIAGARVDGLQPGDRGCAMVFQNYALYPHMSVAANIGYGLKVSGVKRAERSLRVAEIARMLELEHLLERKPGQLSGGQRQRVAMGRAMIRAPKVFLFDEPLSNLDAKLRSAMRTEIRRLHKQLGTTSVFVTHDQLEAMSMADRMVVMNAGRIEQIGTPQQLFRQPASVFVANFIGTPAMNLLPARVMPGGGIETEGGWRPVDDLICSLAPGTALTIGLRPNALHLSDAQPRFTADLCEDVGTELHLHTRSSEGDVIVALPPETPLPQGRFGLRAAPGQIHLFHGETGQRIAAHYPTLPQGETPWQSQPSFT
jgi:sn-glycerol 3-phosphate transport system ATP-binding protein